jgi:hypothetical protein
MKSSVRKYSIAFSATLLLTFGCNDVLDEQPRSQLTPDFFKTGQGLNAGITAAYASFRWYYATEGGMNLTVYGTDEFTHGQQVTNPPLNTYNGSLNPTNGDLLTPWNRSFPAINTCNGIIELGALATDLAEAQRNALIAEAKFIRANWYFILVQTFGGVSLDLGSGPLKFNTSTSNNASRASVAEVYDAIVSDLVSITDGSNNDDLPTTKPVSPGRAWRASALHLLAKVYLTRGWSTAAQAGDFQNAYDAAMDLINNRGNYNVSLLANYADVHKEGNENNSETLFQVNWMDNTTFNNTNAFGGPLNQNRSLWLFRCFYNNGAPGLVRDIAYGRSFVRYKPTAWLMNTAFADKINDSRYDKSFQTVWLVNSTSTMNPKNLALGDTAMWMVPNHRAASVAPAKDSRRYVVFLPDAATDPALYFGSAQADYAGYNVQNKFYPTLTKFNSTQPRAGNDVNISSVRPFIVYRFAETYLIAAEAALKLNKPMTEVAALLNVIRERAADTPAKKIAVAATTVADVTASGVDYVLDERTRELAGEQMRWFDLTRTNKLILRVNLHNGTAARAGAEVPNPQDFHVLRPIPQAQIDLSVDPTTDTKKYQQNTGY